MNYRPFNSKQEIDRYCCGNLVKKRGSFDVYQIDKSVINENKHINIYLIPYDTTKPGFWITPSKLLSEFDFVEKTITYTIIQPAGKWESSEF